MSAGADLISRLLDIERRLRNLETQGVSGGPGSGLDADTVDGVHALGLFVFQDGTDPGALDHAIAAASGVYETDADATLTITPAVVSTLLVFIPIIWDSNVVRASSLSAQAILDDTTVAGATGYVGEGVANNRVRHMVIAAFTGVTAAAHTIKLQVARFDGTDTVTIRRRRIQVLVLPE